MSAIDAYIYSMRKHLRGMDPKVVSDILNELRVHVSDMAAESGITVEEAISQMETPRVMAKSYKELYGYGFAVKLLLTAVAILISIPSLPLFLPASEIAEDPVWLSVFFFGVAAFYLIWLSVVAGKHVGLYAGVSGCVTRFIVLGLMFIFYSEADLGGTMGIISFAVSSMLLIAIGYLPGEAKKRWEGKSPVI